MMNLRNCLCMPTISYITFHFNWVKSKDYLIKMNRIPKIYVLFWIN